MYEENLAHEKEVAAFGLAAEGKGAVKEIDEHTRIWESCFGHGSTCRSGPQCTMTVREGWNNMQVTTA